MLSALVLGLLALAPAAGATPQTSVNEIESEVMCPICGTLLELSDSPQAQREKVYVAKLVAAGKTKAEIKDDLVTQYGPAVLALPKASGFDLSAYLVPIVAFLIAALALALGVGRWRREAKRSGTGPPRDPEGPSGASAERLDEDLARYDL